jgi:hypothetical protein
LNTVLPEDRGNITVFLFTTGTLPVDGIIFFALFKLLDGIRDVFLMKVVFRADFIRVDERSADIVTLFHLFIIHSVIFSAAKRAKAKHGRNLPIKLVI